MHWSGTHSEPVHTRPQPSMSSPSAGVASFGYRAGDGRLGNAGMMGGFFSKGGASGVGPGAWKAISDTGALPPWSSSRG